MNSWNKGDLLKSKVSGEYVRFIEYNPDNDGWFIGTDMDGATYEDWLIDKFEKAEKNENN